MKKGDVVLVSFPFTDFAGNKNRPALVLIESESDITVCFITTQIHWETEFDIVVSPSKQNGLKKESLIRLSKFATVDKDIVLGLLGRLEKKYIIALNQNLMSVLQLRG
jgi:mRNA interferase MazF